MQQQLVNKPFGLNRVETTLPQHHIPEANPILTTKYEKLASNPHMNSAGKAVRFLTAQERNAINSCNERCYTNEAGSVAQPFWRVASQQAILSWVPSGLC
jgi:hypothetical protein